MRDAATPIGLRVTPGRTIAGDDAPRKPGPYEVINEFYHAKGVSVDVFFVNMVATHRSRGDR
ncbi:hypothetical protein GCM10009665_27950 [Kitasatospora nipponensis]|uniref:Uncharacterized protein n=1 Tax=Kitasatospora nipponensis TaxID=258049 RepID=A0ABN1W555_9ACTN